MKRAHVLSAAHHAHLSKIGVPWLRPPFLRIEEEKYREAYEMWQKTRPNASAEWLHRKALGHIAWAEHQKDVQSSVALPVRHPDHRIPLWVIASLLFVLAVLFFAPLAHCQFSHINNISTLNGASPIGFHAAPFRINCNSNMSCTDDGFTFTINSTAAAGSSTFQVNGIATTSQTLLNWQSTTCISVANPSAGNVTFTLACTTPVNTASVAHKWFNAYNSSTGVFGATEPASTDLADFSTTAPSTAGKIPIYDPTAPNAAGGTGAYVPGDPLVQGTQAAASTTQPNPVMGGVWDGTALRALLGDSSGRQTVNINGTVPVSGTFFQATQPISATSLPLPSGAATAAKQPALGTAGTPSADVITVQGAASMTALKVDPSAVTSPVSIAATVNVNCTSGCAGGSSTPADTFTNPTTAGLQMSFPMLWNGSTWDRFYGDKTNGAFVNIKNSIVLSVAQSGTWTVGVNNFPATQPVSCANAATCPTQIGDGTNTPKVQSGATTPAAADNALTVVQSPNSLGCAGASIANTQTFAINNAASGNTQILALSSGKVIYVCSYLIQVGSTNSAKLVYGTGAACATGQTDITGPIGGAAQSGGSLGNGVGVLGKTAASNALCINNTAASQVSGSVTVAQF